MALHDEGCYSPINAFSSWDVFMHFDREREIPGWVEISPLFKKEVA